MFPLSTLAAQALLIGGVSVLMAVMISVIDSIVNNYGDVQLDINGKKQVTVKGGSKLLGTLADQGIFLPSACGGRGSCGACKCQVKSDVGPHLPTEVPYLTQQELRENVRLACQVKVKADIGIEIPEDLFNIKKLSCTVESMTNLTYDIKEVRLKLPEGSDLTYTAGQYGQIEVPAYGGIREPSARAYSFASAPQEKDTLEFLIRLVPGGTVTTYVHKFLKVGDKINVVAPVGDFRVHDTQAAMICVGGGSGMAPFRSIFRDMEARGVLGERDIWYFFGGHSVKDLYFMDWLKELEAKYERFHFIPAVSEPGPGEVWEGKPARLIDVLAEKFKTEIPRELIKEGYLCGSPGMLDACMDIMRKNGMTDDKIYFDKFA